LKRYLSICVLLLIGCDINPTIDPNSELEDQYFVAGQLDVNNSRDSLDAEIFISKIRLLPQLTQIEDRNFSVSNAIVTVSGPDHTKILTEQEPGLYTGMICGNTGDQFSLEILTEDQKIFMSETIWPDTLTFIDPANEDYIDISIDSIENINYVEEYYESLQPTYLTYLPLPKGVDLFSDQGSSVYIPALDNDFQLLSTTKIIVKFLENTLQLSFFSVNPSKLITKIDSTVIYISVKPECVGSYYKRNYSSFQGNGIALIDMPTNITDGYGYFEIYDPITSPYYFILNCIKN